jgi:FlaA1/EpsC-like NDP-sugar epimerase
VSYRTRSILFNAPLDFIVASGAYLLAFSIRLIGVPSTNFQIQFILLSAFILTVSLWFFGVYKQLWEHTSGNSSTVIIRAVLVATALIVILGLAPVARPLPLSVIVVGNLLSLGGFIALRYRARIVNFTSFAALLRGKPTVAPTKILIVGAGKLGQNTAYQLCQKSVLNTYTIVGFIDDDRAKLGMYVEGAPVLGSRTEITTIAKTRQIDLIIVALENVPQSEFRSILRDCESTSARLKIMPDVESVIDSNVTKPLLRDVTIEDLLGRSLATQSDVVDLTAIREKVVLVTGAAGSIGSELSLQMANYRPTHLILLDSNESDLHDVQLDLRLQYRDLQITPILGDITQPAELKAVFEQYHPEIVFHCAAYKHVPMLERYPHKAIQANVFGTKNLAELAHQFQVERFVLISTDKAIDPSSVMGASKRVCELIIHHLQSASGTRFGAVRFGNVLGSRGSVVPIFERQIEAGGPVTITDPEMTRYFLTIPEAVNLVLHAACMTQGGELFVLNMGEEVRILKLAERMIRLRGLRPYIDIPIEFVGIRPGEKLHETLYMEHEEATPTIHPQILRVDYWKGEVKSDFWEQVQNLIEAHDPEVIRKRLQDLVQLQTPVA